MNYWMENRQCVCSSRQTNLPKADVRRTSLTDKVTSAHPDKIYWIEHVHISSVPLIRMCISLLVDPENALKVRSSKNGKMIS